MTTSNMCPVAPETPQRRDLVADGGIERPMSQQDVADAHGHEMRPQKFIRLVGCHESTAGKHEAAHPLH